MTFPDQLTRDTIRPPHLILPLITFSRPPSACPIFLLAPHTSVLLRAFISHTLSSVPVPYIGFCSPPSSHSRSPFVSSAAFFLTGFGLSGNRHYHCYYTAIVSFMPEPRALTRTLRFRSFDREVFLKSEIPGVSRGLNSHRRDPGRLMVQGRDRMNEHVAVAWFPHCSSMEYTHMKPRT